MTRFKKREESNTYSDRSSEQNSNSMKKSFEEFAAPTAAYIRELLSDTSKSKQQERGSSLPKLTLNSSETSLNRH